METPKVMSELENRKASLAWAENCGFTGLVPYLLAEIARLEKNQPTQNEKGKKCN